MFHENLITSPRLLSHQAKGLSMEILTYEKSLYFLLICSAFCYEYSPKLDKAHVMKDFWIDQLSFRKINIFPHDIYSPSLLEPPSSKFPEYALSDISFSRCTFLLIGTFVFDILYKITIVMNNYYIENVLLLQKISHTEFCSLNFHTRCVERELDMPQDSSIF